mgnify:CR=1 FL=1
MEGGRVHRLKPPFTQWPAAKNLGDMNSSNITFQFTQLMGRELKAIGINLDYAPCVDILMNDENEVIGDRALSSDPDIVAKLSSAMVRGYIKSDVLRWFSLTISLIACVLLNRRGRIILFIILYYLL